MSMTQGQGSSNCIEMKIIYYRLSTCRSLFMDTLCSISISCYLTIVEALKTHSLHTQLRARSSAIPSVFCSGKRVLNCENWAPSQSLGRATILWPHHGHADPAGVAVRCHHGLGRIKIGHISVTNPRSGSRTPAVPGMPGHRMHHRKPLPGFVIQHRQVQPAPRCPPKAIGVSLLPPFPWPAWAQGESGDFDPRSLTLVPLEQKEEALHTLV